MSPAPILTDTEVKRQQHIRELIDTEEKFVKDLDVVTEVCQLAGLIARCQFVSFYFSDNSVHFLDFLPPLFCSYRFL